MVKAWRETEKNKELARLFAIGDLRVSDLLMVCNVADEEIASSAFLVLHLLGKSECLPRGERISQKQKGVPFTCGTDIGDADFNGIEAWLAQKHKGNGYDCGEEDEYALTALDDSLVYSLTLDGSSRSRVILNDMLAIEKACGAEGTTIIGEVVSQAESLIVAAKENAHNLQFEPSSLERVIRSSAFFLSSGYRKESQIEVIAYNKTEDRLLLEVSYVCGRLCGSGYYRCCKKKESSSPKFHQ